MKLILIVFSIFFSTAAYCQETKSITVNIDSITGKSQCYIIVGSGGGFTGQVIKYFLLGNGNVYQSNSLIKESSWIKRLSKKETKSVYKKLDALQLDKMNFKHPGNVSYFIEKHGKDKVNSVTWGDNTNTVPAEVDSAYQFIMTKVSNK